MSQEATVICLDNSEWMRNGDYMPTRMEAQHDALNLICSAKTGANPENTVGIVTFAKKSSGSDGAEVVVTLTPDIGKILTSLHQVKLGGRPDLISALQVASLVLKHRQNKKQRQRIILFVGSPIVAETKQLLDIAKVFRKTNVAVDVVNFGEEAENTEKLETFVAAVNNEDNSHLVTVPTGPHILSDILVSSPILMSGGEGGAAVAAAAGGAAAGGGGGFEFGVDPNLDPELAMALRLSMEEERRRQERATATAAPAATGAPAPTAAAEAQGQKKETSEQAPAATTANPDVQMPDVKDEFDDADLAEAIAMSHAVATSPTEKTTTAPKPDETLSEEDEMALAVAMSLKEPPPAPTTDSSADIKLDTDFVNSVVASLPGVDPNDPRIKSVLESLKKDEKKDGDKKQ